MRVVEAKRITVSTHSILCVCVCVQLRIGGVLVQTQTMVTHTRESVVVADTNGTIVDVNDATLALFKYSSADQMVGKNVKMLVPKPLCDQHDELREKLV